MYENPSAGKFEPPPEPPTPGSARPRMGRVAFALLVLSGYPVTHWLRSFRGRGWLTLLAGGASFGLAVLHYAVQRVRADQNDGKDPYTPPTHITR